MFDKPVTEVASMAIDEQGTTLFEEAINSITVGNHVISIIFTVHNVQRWAVKKVETNMAKKTAATSYNVHFKGKDFLVANEKIKPLWLTILKTNGFEYKEYSPEDPANWYGTMGPYLDMFSAYMHFV